MTNLDKLNTLDLHQLFTDENAALKFAYDYDMLYDGGICESTMYCPGKYKVVKDASTHTGLRLKCSCCGKTKSIFYNSVFTRSKIPANAALHILYCWAQECGRDYAAHECDVSPKTITNFYQAFRQACQYHIDNLPQIQIGGAGYNVEIDETLISKRKNNAGRILKEIWVFGGICRETGERFAVQVPNRNAATLIPLIQKYIAPNTTIHSDCWKAYRGISALPENYTHLTVNHSKNFVDPVTGSHTQNIERMWRELKRVRRRYEGINRRDIDEHIAEYLWRCENGVNHSNCFPQSILLVSDCPYH